MPKKLEIEKVFEILFLFVERKGNGKECCPLWVWWKGKGKLSNFDWKERKGNAFRKNGQVNMYDCTYVFSGLKNL